MKITARILVLGLVASLGLDAQSQTNVYDFSTSLGSGSFTVNVNNLTLSSTNVSFNGGTGYGAIYFDSADDFTFNETNYSGVYFTVFNDYNVGGAFLIDGFGVIAGNAGTPGATVITLSDGGKSSIINGTSISDLITVLNSYASLSESFLQPTVSFQNDWPNSGQMGSFDSLQLVTAPEPSTWSLFIAGMGCCLFCLNSRRAISLKKLR